MTGEGEAAGRQPGGGASLGSRSVMEDRTAHSGTTTVTVPWYSGFHPLR